MVCLKVGTPFFCSMNSQCPPSRYLISLAFVVALYCPCSVYAGSETNTQLILLEKQESLAYDPTWLGLLHYDNDRQKSTVLDEDFFISPKGRTDPLEELRAVVLAYDQDMFGSKDMAPYCRFPARYYWLSSQMPVPNLQEKLSECQRLQKWNLFNSTESVSVLFVSGYLGNPASSFGHTLLKLNTNTPGDKIGFFDLTLNYGALIPEGESIYVYAVKGLLGGYQSVFSDRYFYTQDLVYSYIENRDIWSYRLGLSAYEKKLLLFHIWEITGRKFQYFFLKENCGYKSSELLDIVIREDVLVHDRPWYTPVELFFRLLEINKERVNSKSKSLIEDIEYLPSSQRELYAQLQALDQSELGIYRKIVSSGFGLLKVTLEDLPEDSKILILDALLAYLQYEQVSKGTKEPDTDINNKRRQVLLSRFALPSQLPVKVITEPDAPTSGSSLMSFGYSYGQKSSEKFSLINWSPYKKELVGNNGANRDELVVFDVSLGYSHEKNALFLDRFDLIKVTHINTTSIDIAEGYPWSWQVRLGLQTPEWDNQQNIDVAFSFGAGRAWPVSRGLTGYVMLEASAHTQKAVARLKPQVGLLGEYGPVKFLGIIGQESRGYRGDSAIVWEGKLQYNINQKYAFKVEICRSDEARYSLGLNYYW